MDARYVRVGCFGKLPFWPEYLEEELSFASSRWLKSWIHRGRELVQLERDEGAPAVTESRQHRFLLAAPGAPELLAGVIGPSSDLGSRRAFPFALFAHLPKRRYLRHYPLLPLALAPVWEALEDGWRTLAEVPSEGAFRETLAGLQAPLPADGGALRGDYEAGLLETAERVFDERSDGAAWERLVGGMPEVLARIKAGADARTALVELPISGGTSEACLDAAVWLDLLNRQFWLKRLEPSVFLAGGNADRVALYCLGLPDDEDYAYLLGAGPSTSEVLRPAQEGQSDSRLAIPASLKDLRGQRF